MKFYFHNKMIYRFFIIAIYSIFIHYTLALNIQDAISPNRIHANQLYSNNLKNMTCLVTNVINKPFLIPQWIEYHIQGGIDHFYFIVDCIEGGIKNHAKMLFWVEFYRKFGYVDIFMNIQSEECTQKVLLYDDVLKYNLHLECSWILLINPDEYVFPVTSSARYDFISNNFKDDVIGDAVVLPAVTMSTHSIEKLIDDLYISTFTCGKYFGDSRMAVRGLNRSIVIQPTLLPSDTSTLLSSKYSLYIRYYRGMSWRHFHSTSKNSHYPPYTLSNEQEIAQQQIELRQEWEKMNLTNVECFLPPKTQIHAHFQTLMSLEILNIAYHRINHYRNTSDCPSKKLYSSTRYDGHEQSLFSKVYASGRQAYYDHVDWINGAVLQPCPS